MYKSKIYFRLIIISDYWLFYNVSLTCYHEITEQIYRFQFDKTFSHKKSKELSYRGVEMK